jgi:hypothetical protein
MKEDEGKMQSLNKFAAEDSEASAGCYGSYVTKSPDAGRRKYHGLV